MSMRLAIKTNDSSTTNGAIVKDDGVALAALFSYSTTGAGLRNKERGGAVICRDALILMLNLSKQLLT